nr:alpha-mannosidase [Pseudonocardia sp. HH130630-07]
MRETIRKVARTSASMTELIGSTDDFRYGMSSAQQYAWIKEHRPEVYEKVVAAVASGRFVPLGGMWVESDTVMPTGESLVRQFTHGLRFFAEEFGVRPRGVWLPDSFGYSPALPQIMRRAGFEWFFTTKISWNQVNKFPHHTFLWEGIDGSRILSHFPPMDTYNSRLSGEEVAKASRQFRDNRGAGGSIAPVGWGDGGGGTTREMVATAARLADLEGSARVEWEHPDDFFARTREEFASPGVWVGELYLELHRATLTSQHTTKQGNRRTEHRLVEAELWCATAAARTGFTYPHDELDALWKTVLLHQFHDILPGTSIAWVHREAVAEYARVLDRLDGIIGSALSLFQPDQRASASGDREGCSATALTTAAQVTGSPARRLHPHNQAPELPERQVEKGSLAALTGEGDRPVRINPVSHPRDGIDPLGGTAEQPWTGPAVAVEAVDGTHVLDNGVLRVVVDDRGLLTSIVDHTTGREAVRAGRPANLLQLHPDFPNMWDAWDVDRFYRNRVDDLVDLDELTVTVEDAGVARVRVARSFSASTVVQVLSLAPGSRTVEVEQTADWHETEKFLKVAFPLDVRAEETVAETQFGATKRVTHTNTSWEAAKFETSMHRYVLVQEPGFGVALVNDSSYGFDVTRDAEDGEITTTLRLSLLRAPRFPDPRTDQGPQTHRYGMVVGTDLDEATRAGIGTNLPLRTVRGDHGFEPLVTVGGGVVVSSVKQADDRSGDLVVRVYEPSGRRRRASVRVNGPFGGAREVPLTEDDAAATPVGQGTDGAVVVDVRAFDIRTLRFSRTS